MMPLREVNRRVLMAAVMLLSICLAGCIDEDVVVKVKPDGSGTVVERILIKSALFMKDASGKPISTPAKPLSDYAVTMKIASYGGKVRLVSNQPVTDGGEVGYRAEFAFDDINQFKLPANPNAGIGGDFYTFHQTTGATTRLQVINSKDWLPKSPEGKMPEERQIPEEEKKAEADAIKKLTADMVKMLDGAKISFRVEVEGKILQSNAQFQTDSGVDLMNMDFGLAAKSPDFEKTMAIGTGSIKPTREDLLAVHVPGLHMELQKEIFIEYQ